MIWGNFQIESMLTFLKANTLDDGGLQGVFVGLFKNAIAEEAIKSMGDIEEIQAVDNTNYARVAIATWQGPYFSSETGEFYLLATGHVHFDVDAATPSPPATGYFLADEASIGEGNLIAARVFDEPQPLDDPFVGGFDVTVRVNIAHDMVIPSGDLTAT